jgi:hypothetical protein
MLIYVSVYYYYTLEKLLEALNIILRCINVAY